MPNPPPCVWLLCYESEYPLRNVSTMYPLLTAAFLMLTVTHSVWSTTETSLHTEIVMEDGSPYYVPVSATVVSGNPIRWDNPTPTHHTVTHNGCAENGSPCLFDSGPVSPG